MFDHVGLKVRDLAASAAFYRNVLAPLGHVAGASGDDYAGFGPPDAPALWLYRAPQGLRFVGTHLAFRAADRAAVERFHAAGLSAGARDHGAPGLRADYGERYYAAFLLDPDGHNIEAVCLD